MWYWHDSTCTHAVHMCAEFQGCCLYPHMAKWTRVSLVTGIVSLSLWFRVLLGGAWSREPWYSPMEMSIRQGRSPLSRTMGGGMRNHALRNILKEFFLTERTTSPAVTRSVTHALKGRIHPQFWEWEYTLLCCWVVVQYIHASCLLLYHFRGGYVLSKKKHFLTIWESVFRDRMF